MHCTGTSVRQLALILVLGCSSYIVITVPSQAEEAPDRQTESYHNRQQAIPRPIPRARWSEDWSSFGNATPLTYPEISPTSYFWSPLKNIPIGHNRESYLNLGGELRLAYEIYDEKDMSLADIGYQDALQLRAAIHGDLHLTRKWRLFGQFGYGVVDNREGGEKTADEADINAWELFIGRRFLIDEQERVVVRLGRQLIEAANLFINVGEGNNIRQHYDGLRVGWIDKEFVKLDLFAAEYVDFSDENFSMSGTGEYFWGATGGFRFAESLLSLSCSYFGWDLKDRQFQQGGAGRHDEQRHTLLLRLNQPINLERQLQRPLSTTDQLGLDYYLAYQFGEYEDRPGGSSIHSFAGFGEIRYGLYPKPDTPVIGLKTAYFSGDDDQDDSELNTFYNHVFATPFFGYARDIQPFNLIYVQPNIGYNFGDGAIITLGYGFHWRADTNDAFYSKPNGITASAGSSESSWLGHQVQLSARYLINPNLLLTGYIARFFAGDMIVDAGGDDRDYLHLGIHYLF